MYLVSTGKTTVLSHFLDLNLISTYQHVNGESTDFQFYTQKRIFVEVNKKSGLEILRIKENEEHKKMEIQRVRKLTVENVYCVACAKQSLDEMALGLSNGQVKLYNYKKSEFVHRFNAENIRNSVLYLDYNGSDEYMASVYENGQINIFGIKTKAKIDTLNIDGNSTLARFHPTKRFHLSIASHKGTVTIYDVQTKRKIFNSTESHNAPCRDLCMSAAVPDTLISVGYDCMINIFDTRRKTQPLQISYCHPLSTVALSDCGSYFCVGNLKGELTTFDMRHTKACLVTRKVHDSAVTRIAFVPQSGETGVASFSNADNFGEASHLDGGVGGAVESRKSFATSTATRGHRDSFCDFLDFQANKGLEKMSSRFATRRDSFDWETLTRKPNEEKRISLMVTSGPSFSSANNSVEGRSQSLDKSNEPFTLAPASDNTTPLRDCSNMTNANRNSNFSNQQLSGKLKLIQEEQVQHNNTTDSDKENPTVDFELGNRLRILPTERNSTPNRVSSNLPEAPIKPNQIKNQELLGNASSLNTDFSREIADLRTEMSSRLQQLEAEIKFNAEHNKWQIFTQSANLWSRQIDTTEEIRDALGILMHSDPFVNECFRLKKENEMLKAQIQQMLTK